MFGTHWHLILLRVTFKTFDILGRMWFQIKSVNPLAHLLMEH